MCSHLSVTRCVDAVKLDGESLYFTANQCNVCGGVDVGQQPPLWDMATPGQPTVEDTVAHPPLDMAAYNKSIGRSLHRAIHQSPAPDPRTDGWKRSLQQFARERGY